MDEKLFVGPGTRLIIPFVLQSNKISKTSVPWGYYYKEYPFELIRKASYLELYICTKYQYNKPRGE